MTTTKQLHRLATMSAVVIALALCVGCTSGPAKRHAELEWSVRRDMPTWGPDEWNAWEAELASALDKPRPDPAMFPDPDDDDDDGEN
ncbi:MAG: hypothetical protein AB7K09_15655 [Planctomycetota bacterium]